MNTVDIIIVGTFLGTSFGLLCFLMSRLDKMSDKMEAGFGKLSDRITTEVSSLRQEISSMNMRISRIEGSLNPFHPEYFHPTEEPTKGKGSKGKKEAP